MKLEMNTITDQHIRLNIDDIRRELKYIFAIDISQLTSSEYNVGCFSRAIYNNLLK